MGSRYRRCRREELVANSGKREYLKLRISLADAKAWSCERERFVYASGSNKCSGLIELEWNHRAIASQHGNRR